MARRYVRRRSSLAQPEITLTPLIDTALTLLIIFMVTAPMIQNTIKVDLPKGDAKECSQSVSQELIVTIDKQEHIYFNNTPITLDLLGSAIKKQMDSIAHQGKKYEPRVWVRVDRHESCSANMLINVIDRIKTVGGIKDVAIAMEQRARSA